MSNLPNKTPCILVIDDNASIRQYIQDTLSDEGYTVILANDGETGLLQLSVYQPDLILLDMYMPSVDGWSFLAAFPQTPLPHAPIIAMSSEVDVKHLPGVKAGLPKPFTIDGLLNVVTRFVSKPTPGATDDTAPTG